MLFEGAGKEMAKIVGTLSGSEQCSDSAQLLAAVAAGVCWRRPWFSCVAELRPKMGGEERMVSKQSSKVFAAELPKS